MIRHALESLVRQSWQDWVCEVRNDWPGDAAIIQEIVDSLGDPRFVVIHHRENLGGTRAFNLAFESRHDEPFFSILEDDNSWCPEFLSRMVTLMEENPQVAAAWCNQKVRIENPGGDFEDSDELVDSADGPPRLIEYGDVRQALGSRHADGAMIVRTSMNKGLTLPADLPFSAIEMFRDRAYPYPLLYVPEPLAVFTNTQQTGRSDSVYEWLLMQSLAAASFLRFCEQGFIADIFSHYRSAEPRATNPLLLGLLMEGRLGVALRHATPADWLLLLKAIVRRPHLLRILVPTSKERNWMDFLDRNTRQRFIDRRRRSVISVGSPGR